MLRTYSVWAMVLAGVVAGLGLGCDAPDENVTLLSNEKFTAITLASSPWVSTNVLAQLEEEEGRTNLVEQAMTTSSLIVPGTHMYLRVDEDPSIDNEYFLRPGGVIEVKHLGRMEVEGMTGDELAMVIKEKLEKDFLRQATVHVEIDRDVGGGVIYVLGSVGRQGPIALPVNQKFTVLQAILAAGGVGQFGDDAKIQVIRYGEDGTKYKTLVNLARIQKYGEFEKDIPLVNGDWLLVPEKLFSF